MKKNLSLLVLFAQFFALTAYADLAPTVMLRHGGNTTFYKYYEVQNAVDAAVDGDTIYLTDGTYQPFNINKRIMVRGAGPTTMIEGDCEIDISGTAKLTMPVLDAICFNGNVIVKSAYKQFTLRKCKMVDLIWNESNEFWDTKVTQCYFTNMLNLPNNVKEFNAFNSKINYLHPHDYTEGQATFNHCNIGSVTDTISNSSFYNCCIYETSGGRNKSYIIGCVLKSCTLSAYDVRTSNCSMVDCIKNLGNADYMEWKSYYAPDGTLNGVYGGQYPFSLNPELPTVTKYQLGVDPTTKTMHVKLTVTKP